MKPIKLIEKITEMHKIKKKILNEYKMIKISPNIYKPNGIEILLD